MSAQCCAICCSLIESEALDTVSCKGHHFHYDCISSAVSMDSRCPVCRLDFASVGFSYRGKIMYPDKERLTVEPSDEHFHDTDTEYNPDAINVVMAEGFDEEDAALALLRCNDDPQQAIALLVAEEDEDRTDSEEGKTAGERCSQCGAVSTGGARGQDDQSYCLSCWSDWDKTHDEEMLALALDISKIDVGEVSGPTHLVHLPNRIDNDSDVATLRDDAASSSGRLGGERRWKRRPDSQFDERPELEQDDVVDNIILPPSKERRQRRWGNSR